LGLDVEKIIIGREGTLLITRDDERKRKTTERRFAGLHLSQKGKKEKREPKMTRTCGRTKRKRKGGRRGGEAGLTLGWEPWEKKSRR